MRQMVITAINHNDFKERLEKAIASYWLVKFMVANNNSFVAVLEMK